MKQEIQTNDTRKIWQQFDYFGAGSYLSLSFILFLYGLRVYVFWCMLTTLKFVPPNCSFFLPLLQKSFAHSICSVSKGLNVFEFTKSCFLFIYFHKKTNFFFISTSSLNFSLTFRQKKKKKNFGSQHERRRKQSLVKREEKRRLKRQKRWSLYQSMCIFCG